ncbi:MAG: helix-turn-helix domain-containing protein [Bacteroidetes bacterium]|nr:helix-turn-helix domain-containing protein [Bacteroidota bacterium]
MEFVIIPKDELNAVIKTAMLEALSCTNQVNIKLPPQYLTEAEAMEKIKVSRGTLLRLRKQRKIPYHRAGKRILYDENELREALRKS